MRYRYDTLAEALGVLSGKVWYLDVRLEQALLVDGETADKKAPDWLA